MGEGNETEGKKPPPDWERIEAHFRAGILSLREIADPYEITEGAIRKRAKSKNWSRDLGAKIKARTEELVRKEAVRTESTQPEYRVPESQVIEANAQVHLAVDRRQKGTAKRGQALVDKLLAEVESMTDNIPEFEKLGELLDKTETTESGRVIEDKLNKAYHAAISLPGRVDSLKKLADTFEKFSKFERVAFKLEDAAPPPDEGETLTPERTNEALRRFAFLLSRAAAENT